MNTKSIFKTILAVDALADLALIGYCNKKNINVNDLVGKSYAYLKSDKGNQIYKEGKKYLRSLHNVGY